MKTKTGEGALRQGSSYEQHNRADRGRLFSHVQNRGTIFTPGRNRTETGARSSKGNGAEALAVLQENSADLILCDINMPAMDGLEFVKQLAGVDKAKGVPVVMIIGEGLGSLRFFGRRGLLRCSLARLLEILDSENF